jgi:hypothetical protein
MGGHSGMLFAFWQANEAGGVTRNVQIGLHGHVLGLLQGVESGNGLELGEKFRCENL